MSDSILLRLTDELANLVREQARIEDRSVQDLLREGLVIRCKLPLRDKLPDLLEKWGYTPPRPPGRPKLDNGDGPDAADVLAEAPAPVPASVNSGDGWDLSDTDGV